MEWSDRSWADADTPLLTPHQENRYGRLSRADERDGPNHGVAVEPGYHPIDNAWVTLAAFGE